ncbi:MAG: TetR/AcrR family transcriptional regulator, partial [Actinomycetota bacterium]
VASDPDQIADAALDAIASGGYEALSMRGVARTVGVSLATVQRNFPSKDELWRAAVDRFFEKMTDHVGDIEDRPLVAVIERLLDRSAGHPGLVARLAVDSAPGHQDRHRYIARRIADRHERAAAVIAERQQLGVGRKVDPAAVVLLVSVGIGAIASAPGVVREIYGYELEDPDDRARLAAALADVLGYGLHADG